MKKKLLSILALLCMTVTGAWAESFTITFKSASGTSDSSTKVYTVDAIVEDGATYVSSLEASDIYNAKSGYGLKFGTASKTGSLKLTLANEVKNVTSIVVNARQYGSGTETTLKIQDKSDYTTTTEFTDYTYTYDTPASVSAITLATTSKRTYIKSVTVNYTASQGGGDPQPAGNGDAYNLTVGETAHGTIAFTVDGQAATTAQEGQTVTVEITPATGWVVNQPSGQWYAAIAAAPSQAPSIDLLNSVELTPVKDVENRWTFTMQRANVEISATYKKLLQDSWIQDIAAVTYTSQAQTPTVVVKDGETTLLENTDYTVSYSNNVNAALATATTNAPTVTITAVSTSDKYAGEATKTFTINPATLTAATLENTNLVYNKEEQSAVVASVTAGTLPVPADGYDVTENSGTNVGNYTAKVTGKGNFTGTVEAPFSIIPADAKLFTLTVEPDEFIYNGTAQVPTITVKDGDNVLVENTDYTLTITNNVNAGTAIVTAIGKGNYAGTQTATFTIKKAESKLMFNPMMYTKTIGDEDFYIIPWLLIGDGSLSYWSENESIAKVYNSGMVTIMGIGTVKIWAKITDASNYIGASNYYELTIVANKTELSNTITEADSYYESIKNEYPDIAATLLEAINKAKSVLNNPEASQQAVNDALAALKAALQAAKNAVTTGISTIEKGQLTMDNWYDLRGQRLSGQPAQKGVYINNGRKIVVK